MCTENPDEAAAVGLQGKMPTTTFGCSFDFSVFYNRGNSNILFKHLSASAATLLAVRVIKIVIKVIRSLLLPIRFESIKSRPGCAITTLLASPPACSSSFLLGHNCDCVYALSKKEAVAQHCTPPKIFFLFSKTGREKGSKTTMDREKRGEKRKTK